MTIPDPLILNACFSADSVAIGFKGSSADLTKAIVQRTLEALEANGMITIIPEREWPEYYIPDPPYKAPWDS